MKNRLLLIPGILALHIVSASAQTVVSGPYISGNWSTAGSPYIIASDCTVPAGMTLTIQPGTVVWLGQDVSLTVQGLIQAVGTPLQRITFQAPIATQRWRTITVSGADGTNEFRYCDFHNPAESALAFAGNSASDVSYCVFQNSSNGVSLSDSADAIVSDCSFQNLTNGISLTAWADTVRARINGCIFTNCVGQAIGGDARCAYWFRDATINLEAKNCLFLNSGTGCTLRTQGLDQPWAGIGWAYAPIKLSGNIFRGLSGPAVGLEAGAYTGGAAVSVVNNVIEGCGAGVVVADPFDATIQNCIFKQCSNAVMRSGSLSTMVGYNTFFGNATNFVGYPVNYGQPIIVNRNGTPADLLFNIFTDPLFVSATDLRLQPGSPCVDAGEGSAANYDTYFPPSLGGVINDMGAYGGPNAGRWVAPAPTNVFSLAVVHVPYVSVTINPAEPGHYRLEYANSVGTNTNWTQLTNLVLSTAPFTYLEPAASPSRIYRAVKQ